jgi:MFS transporter, DHA1 family, multidrug resistance protein
LLIVITGQWPTWKKAIFAIQIYLLTVVIYMGASIFGPGVGDLAQKFGISQVLASLGITVFVVGYALGPVCHGLVINVIGSV